MILHLAIGLRKFYELVFSNMGNLLHFVRFVARLLLISVLLREDVGLHESHEKLQGRRKTKLPKDRHGKLGFVFVPFVAHHHGIQRQDPQSANHVPE